VFATGSTPFYITDRRKRESFQKVINKNCCRNSGRVLAGVNKLVYNRRLITSVFDIKLFAVLIYFLFFCKKIVPSYEKRR